MPGIDGSIPASVVVPKNNFNPLEIAGQVAQTANLMNQNRLFQQEFKARSAIGPLYQQAIDPQTGRLDANKLLSLASQNPDTAFQAGDLAASGQARELQQTQIDQQQLALHLGQSQAFRQRLAPLLAKGADVTPKDVYGVAGDLVKSGILPAETVIGELGNLPSDAKGLAGWVQQHYVQALNAEQQMQAVYGSPTTFDTGNALQPAAVSPMTGVHPLGAPIAKGLSPEAQTSPAYQYFDPQTRQMKTVLKGQIPANGQPAAIPGAGIPAGPPLGTPEAAAVTGHENAAQAIALQQRAAQTPQNKAVLGNMEARLDSFDPGPQSQWWKNLGQLAAEYHQKIPLAPPADKTAAQEEFGKLAFQLAQQQFTALGGTGTDSKLDSTMHTSPSELLSRYGNKGIIHILKGNEDAINAQNQAWQKWQGAGNGPESYGQFLSQWNQVYDPRVFQSQYLSPPERQQLLKGMTRTEQARFARSLEVAQSAGWLQ